MKIETKFEPGRKVYAISSYIDSTTGICKGCDGEKTISDKIGTKHTCPVCYGRGNHKQNQKRKYKVVPLYVASVIIRVRMGSTEENYFLTTEFPTLAVCRQPRKASDVFTTEQEAQEAINRRNKDEV